MVISFFAVSPLGLEHKSWHFRGKTGESASKYRDSRSQSLTRFRKFDSIGISLGIGTRKLGLGKLCYQPVLKAWMVLESSLKSRKVRSRGQYSWHLDCLSATDKNDKSFRLKFLKKLPVKFIDSTDVS